MAKGMIVRRGGGGGLPSDWTEEVTATYLENINAGDAIEYRMSTGNGVFSGSVAAYSTAYVSYLSRSGLYRVGFNLYAASVAVQKYVGGAWTNVWSTNLPFGVNCAAISSNGSFVIFGTTDADSSYGNWYNYKRNADDTYSLVESVRSYPEFAATAQARVVKISPDDQYVLFGHWVGTGTNKPALHLNRKVGDIILSVSLGAVRCFSGFSGSATKGLNIIDIDCSLLGDYWPVAYYYNSAYAVALFKRTGDELTNIATVFVSTVAETMCCAITPDAHSIYVGAQSPNKIYGYSVINDAVTAKADAVVQPPNVIRDFACSPDNKYLVVAHMYSPFVSIYDITQNPIAKTANPAVLPPAHAYYCGYSGDGKFFFAQSPLNAITTYLTSASDFIIPLHGLVQQRYGALNQYASFGLGMAEETKLAGEQGKALMFKKINDAAV